MIKRQRSKSRQTNSKVMMQCKLCESEFESKMALVSHKGQVHTDELPWNDEEKLREYYLDKEHSTTELAEKWGCSDTTIENKCREIGILRQPGVRVNRTYEKLGDKDWINEKYNIENLSTRKIAEIVGCTKMAVIEAMEDHGLERDNRGKHLEGVTGEDHNSWKGGHSHNRGHTWPEKRKEALERDNWCCQNCGCADKEHQQKRSQSLHVHHIERYDNFDSQEEANQLHNLVTVCRECHDVIEGLNKEELENRYSITTNE